MGVKKNKEEMVLPDEDLLDCDKDQRDDKEAEGEVEQERGDLHLGAVALRIQPQIPVVMNLEVNRNGY